MQNKYKNDDNNKFLISKIQDKQKACETKNKITYSDFLNQREKLLIIKNIKMKNYFFFGGKENSDREVLFFYPEKIEENTARKAVKDILSVIRISLPNAILGEYEHRNYLSALIKIGVVREKIGDILVDENGADIVVFNSNLDFIKNSLGNLTRFKKAKIENLKIDDLKDKIDKFETKSIIVSSMRIDNIVSELANCSRSKAEELIANERVQVNYELVYKSSKIVETGNIITIRGKGKFIIDDLVRNTKSGKLVINIRKYR